MTDQIRGYLSMHPVTLGLTFEEQECVARNATLVTLATGEFLHRAGQAIDAVYLIHSGRLSLSMELPNGRRQTILALGPGHQIGVIAMLSEESMPIDAIVEETVELIRFSSADAMMLAQNFPVLRKNFLKSVGRVLGDRLLSSKLDVPARAVSCLVMDDRSRHLLPALTARLAALGEQVVVLSDQHRRFHEGVRALPFVDETGQRLPLEQIREMVGSQPENSRVFLETGPVAARDDLHKLYPVSDQVWWVGAPDSAGEMIDLMENLLGREPVWREKSFLVWCLDRQEPMAPSESRLAHLIRRDFKVWPQADGMSWVRQTSLERLVHAVRGVQVGLALGGGAARGMAHLGVMQALQDAGIVVDMLSGTSAGVLSGFTWCAGFEPDYSIESFTRDLTPGRKYSWLPGGDSLYLLRKYRTGAWDGMLRNYFFDWRLEQCPLPGYSITADLVQASQVIRASGDMVHAILESINLPVLAPPICRNGQALVDGGVLNVLPADVLVGKGCNLVIGVNVSSKIQHSFAGNTPETPTEKMRTPGIVKTLLRSFDVLDRNMSAVGAGVADFTIEPDVSEMDPAGFRDTPALAARGQAATVEAIPALREMLHRLDPDLFPI